MSLPKSPSNLFTSKPDEPGPPDGASTPQDESPSGVTICDKGEPGHDATEEFIRELRVCLSGGKGVIPLIGAGFSTPAGIPLVKQLSGYLNRCICDALGAGGWRRRWDPQKDRWPLFVDGSRPEPHNWLSDLWAYFDERKSADPYDIELAVIQEGIGAMAEWRSALLFLSRLSSPLSKNLVLLAPRQDLIDACFREVMRDKSPALNHRMMAALAGLLRLDLILTTNFDDLLERAFQQAGTSLSTFDVQLGSSLPDRSAVSRVRAIVKLHGSQHSLRADYSLDNLPTEQDRLTFSTYVAGEPIGPGGETTRKSRNVLLVMGVSAQEQRTLAFLKHCWGVFDDFTVFWVCFSPRDMEVARAFAVDMRMQKGRMILLRHNNLGLLLLQLYQRIRRNLPARGAVFPSARYLAVPPYPTRRKDASLDDGRDDAVREIKKQLKEFGGRHGRPYGGHKLIVATSPEHVHGITSACSEVFFEMDGSQVCLWFDMNDIQDTDSLFEVLVEAANGRSGTDNWMPTYVEAGVRHRVNELRRLSERTTLTWTFFINARETPGANRQGGNTGLNGWLDGEVNQGTPDFSEQEKFIELVSHLSGPNSPRLNVVVLCYGDKSSLVQKLIGNELVENDRIVRIARPSLKPGSEITPPYFEPFVTADRVIVWTAQHDGEPYEIKERQRRQRFLHSLALLQRSRHLAAIWHLDTPGPDQDSEEEMRWVAELAGLGLLRWKVGGFIWMHSPIRQALRYRLREPIPKRKEEHEFPSRHAISESAADVLRNWKPDKTAVEIHLHLADWYVEVLDATRSSLAVFESVDHLCLAAVAAKDKRTADFLRRAAAMLKSNSFLIQTHGYSKGSCRRLEHIRKMARSLSLTDPIVIHAVMEIESVCAEVMRAIAREVGEDNKAYQRHREYSAALAGITGYDDDKDSPKRQSAWRKRMKENRGDLVPGSITRLRWHRWSGMLAIASRSYDAGERTLLRGIVEFLRRSRSGDGAQYFSSASITGLLSDFRRLSPAESVELLRCLEESVALLLLRDGAMSRRSDPPQARSGPGSLAEITKINRLIVASLDLAQAITQTDKTSEAQFAIQANWCKSRLLIHKSHALLREQQLRLGCDALKTPVNYQPAMSVLGEAEACLRVSTPQRYKADQALVELNRAEVRLREASWIAIGTNRGAVQFRNVVRELSTTVSDPPAMGSKDAAGANVHTLLASRQALRIAYFGEKPDRSGWTPARSLIQDAMRFLDRAAPVLRERRKNVWWTSWYFERRMRAIAFGVWATILDSGPVPYLGREWAASDDATEPTVLLDEALRVIRTDAYRLATIVLAYAWCARGLDLRLQWDPKADPRLDARVIHMQSNLRWALGELRTVNERRLNVVHSHDKPDKNAQAFVKCAEMDIEAVIKALDWRRPSRSRIAPII
jgi:hypothetical protein